MPRHAHIEIDPAAITANVRFIAEQVGSSRVCAVVKADGYGHGSVRAALAALQGGAQSLAVALAEEGVALRQGGIDAPILVLSELSADAMIEAHAAGLTPTVYSVEGIEAARSCVSKRAWPVHLKIDTGMHRVGADMADALTLARRIHDSDELELAGTLTHLAVADEPERSETTEQLERFESVINKFTDDGIDPGVRHAANSAGALRWPRSHFDMVRVGIAIYGYSPFGPDSSEATQLAPAMTFRSEVSFTRRLKAGDRVSYGLRHTLGADGTVAIVPVGYADGIDRRLGTVGGEVLIGGEKHRVIGTVTMDQIIVSVSDGAQVERGDEVVLIGSQGDETITADVWAGLLDTIPYEVVCRFGSRLPRVVRSGSMDSDPRWGG